MSVEAIPYTPADGGGLVTLDRARLAPLLAGAGDEMLSAMVLAASDAIENHLRRAVIYRQRVETHDGRGQRELMLDEGGVQSIDAVSVRDAEGTVWTIPTGDFYFEAGTGELWFADTVTNAAGWRHFARGRRNVSITYTAGICADQASVPASIAQACVELVARMLDSSRHDPSMIQERLGDYTIQRNAAAQELDALPATIRGALEFYRNRVL